MAYFNGNHENPYQCPNPCPNRSGTCHPNCIQYKKYYIWNENRKKSMQLERLKDSELMTGLLKQK